MKARLIIVVLLGLAMWTATPLRPVNALENRRVDSEEEESKLTPEDEREVRDLAARFTKRWRETNDFEQIMDEMFVTDFSEGLWRAPSVEMPWWFIDKNLVAYAGRDELRRYYIATMNFHGLLLNLYDATEALKQPSETDEQSRVTDILSPEVMNLLYSDPTLAQLAQMYKGDDEHESTKEAESSEPAPSVDSPQAAGATSQADGGGDAKEDSEEGLIKTIPQMDSFTATLEKANELLRKRLANLPPITPKPSSGDDDEKSRKDKLEVYSTTLDEGEYNYPEGTPVVRLKVLPFALTLIKTDGRFKILTASIYVD